MLKRTSSRAYDKENRREYTCRIVFDLSNLQCGWYVQTNTVNRLVSTNARMYIYTPTRRVCPPPILLQLADTQTVPDNDKNLTVYKYL
jgi:hypothetical protein